MHNRRSNNQRSHVLRKAKRDVLKKIRKGQFSLPCENKANLLSEDGYDLLRKIIVPNPSERLGNFARAEMDIKDHPWFADIDFKALKNKDIAAPWKPKIENELDVSAFDFWDYDGRYERRVHLTFEEQNLFKDFSI